MYVTLEPCAHFGKTLPCTDIIIEKKIKRVIIGSFDPNPLVSGKGIEKLRKNRNRSNNRCFRKRVFKIK